MTSISLDSYAYDDAGTKAYQILWQIDKLAFGSDPTRFINKAELQLLYCFLLATCESGDLDLYFDEKEEE